MKLSRLNEIYSMLSVHAGSEKLKGLNEYHDEMKRLQAELAALKTPPRCPKCGSEEVEVLLQGGNERLWFLWCADCSIPSYNFPTIDAALNAWRKGETK